jgi:hypothetical protein
VNRSCTSLLVSPIKNTVWHTPLAEELEEHRRKLQARLTDVQDQLETAHRKVASVESLRQKMAVELDEARVGGQQ